MGTPEELQAAHDLAWPITAARWRIDNDERGRKAFPQIEINGEVVPEPGLFFSH